MKAGQDASIKTKTGRDSDLVITLLQSMTEDDYQKYGALHFGDNHDKELGRVAKQAQKFGINDPVFTFSERGIHVYGYSTSI